MLSSLASCLLKHRHGTTEKVHLGTTGLCPERLESGLLEKWGALGEWKHQGGGLELLGVLALPLSDSAL